MCRGVSRSRAPTTVLECGHTVTIRVRVNLHRGFEEQSTGKGLWLWSSQLSHIGVAPRPSPQKSVALGNCPFSRSDTIQLTVLKADILRIQANL
jgi:hypothetical protein